MSEYIFLIFITYELVILTVRFRTFMLLLINATCFTKSVAIVAAITEEAPKILHKKMENPKKNLSTSTKETRTCVQPHALAQRSITSASVREEDRTIIILTSRGFAHIIPGITDIYVWRQRHAE